MGVPWPLDVGGWSLTRSHSSLVTLAIFLSATLLFMVQPLTGKILLPVLGGSPAVWSTCMVFFQAVLLLGYLYAHALSSRVAPRWQWLVHAGVLLAASTVLPLPVDVGEPGAADPRWWALRVLAATVGLPFFALSATAPLLQHWFSRTSDRQGAGSVFPLCREQRRQPARAVRLSARRADRRAERSGGWVGGCILGRRDTDRGVCLRKPQPSG